MKLQSSQQPAQGFSLIELITVIVIIGVLAAAAGPRLFNNTPFSERGYTDEVAAAIRYANSVAVSSGCGTSVDLTATTYQVMQQAPLGNSCDTAGAWNTPVLSIDDTNPVTGAVAGSAPANVTLSPATQIVFDQNGKVSGGAPPPLFIGTHTINIDPFSGRVTVQ